MAEPTIKSDIFKFVSLRPPVSLDEKNKQKSFISDIRVPAETPVGRLAAGFNSEDGKDIPEQVKRFIQDNKYELNFPSGDAASTLVKINEFLKDLSADDFSEDNLRTSIEAITGQSINEFYNSELVKQQLNEIWDR